MKNPHIIIIICLVVFPLEASFSQESYDRGYIFNTAKKYDTQRFRRLAREQHEIQLEMFSLINEAAVTRDRDMKYYLDGREKTLGYIPMLAVRHYKYAFGDKSQLDWLLAEDAKSTPGSDSLILIVFGYIDEWEETIKRFKKHDKVADGAGGEVLSEAMEIRKQLYGEARFDEAWERVKID